MEKPIQFNCCVCGKAVLTDDEDSYVLQIRKSGMTTPEMLKSHGRCLRKVIPVVGEEIPT
jgi:hypothetical protein